MPTWDEFQPFIVTGLALGGVYALSGAGMVVLYRTTGVLNLAFGAVGALGALISWDLINNSLWPEWPSYGVAVVFCGGVTLVAVTGKTDMPDSVRPKSGISSHFAETVSVFFVK